MTKRETELLKAAYTNYLKTFDMYFEFRTKTGDELVYYTDAASSLAASGYIEAISENIEANAIDITMYENWLVCYELTEAGLHYAQSNLKG